MPALIMLILSAFAPLFAKGSEGWWGLVPCELCLLERWPYWVAAGLALLALLLRPARRPLLYLAALAVLVSGAIGALHVGVEHGWWPSPFPSCRAPTGRGVTDINEMLKEMAVRPSKPCDAPTFLVPGIPISMAGFNLIYALVVGLFGFRLARRS